MCIVCLTPLLTMPPGGLLNSVAGELVDSVAALEDISADDAVQLALLLNLVMSRAPELFMVCSRTLLKPFRKVFR